MSGHVDPFWQERIALRYVDAHDAGDLETVAALWEEATRDPELAELLQELDEGLETEAQGVAFEEAAAVWEQDAARVLELARAQVPSAFPLESGEAPPPLTSADVARRLEVDPQLARRLTPADREANGRLIQAAHPLPDDLAQPALDRWVAALGVSASAFYWRTFRHVAVLLTMARCQQAGTIAAARDAKPRDASRQGKVDP